MYKYYSHPKYIKIYSRDLEKKETNVFKKLFKRIKKKVFLIEQKKVLRNIEKEYNALFDKFRERVESLDFTEASYWEHAVDMLDFERNLIQESIKRLK
jgi:hypothetical protein